MKALRCVLAAGAAVVVAACGPQDEPRAQTLRVLMEPDGRGAWHELFAEFERRHPDIRLQLIEGPASTDAREDLYVNALLSGSGDFDLVYADTVWIPKFAAAGWLEDLTDGWSRETWDDFVPATIAGGSYRGRIYRVPVQLNGGLLYYRRDILGTTPPPRTFEELRTLSEQFAIPGERTGFVWQGRQYEGLVCNFLEVLRGFGGFWIDAESGEVGLESPEALRALEFLRATVGTISPPGVTTYAEEEGRLLFQNGETVFLRNWPYVLRLAERETLGIAPLPAHAPGVSSPTFGGAGFSIVRTSPAKAAAWEFLDFLRSPDVVDAINRKIGLQPAQRSFYARSTDPLQKELFAILEKTVPRPAIPQYAQASDILQRHVSAALTGQTEPAEALRAAAAEIRRLLK